MLSGNPGAPANREARIDRRELTARDFSPDEGFKSGGILRVFPALETAQLGKRFAAQPKTIYPEA